MITVYVICIHWLGVYIGCELIFTTPGAYTKPIDARYLLAYGLLSHTCKTLVFTDFFHITMVN